MPDSVVLTVPDHLLAMYAVATTSAPDAASVSGLGKAFPGVTAEVLPAAQAPLPSAPLLRAMGSPATDVADIGRASLVTMVQSAGNATWPPVHEFAARAAAGRLAEAYDGVVVDLRVPKTSPAVVPAEAVAAVASFRLVDWVLLPHSPDRDGLWFTTKGLSRFGLPELQTHDVPARLAGAWGAVLSGMAHVLLRDQWSSLRQTPDVAFREVAAEHLLTLRDIALAYSDRARTADDPALDHGTAIRVELDPAAGEQEETHLSVVPPAGLVGGMTAWCRQVVATVFAPAGRSSRPPPDP